MMSNIERHRTGGDLALLATMLTEQICAEAADVAAEDLLLSGLAAGIAIVLAGAEWAQAACIASIGREALRHQIAQARRWQAAHPIEVIP